MGLFGNKKKGSDPVQPLSEREIQSRLYGHLREPSVPQEDLPSFSKPKQESSFFQKSVSVTAKTLTPSATPPAHKPAIVTSPELFDDSDSEVENTSKSFGDTVVKKKEPSFKSTSYTGKPSTASKPSRVGGSSVSAGAGKVFQWLSVAFKTLGVKVLEVIGWAVTSVIRVAALIDFKKPAVRRLLMIGATAIVFAFIFFGIHQLNLRRETAMKQPPKAVVIPRHAKESKSRPAETETTAAVKETNAVKAVAEKKAGVAKKTAEVAAVPAAGTTAKTPEAAKTVEVVPAVPAAKPVEKTPVAGKKIEGPAYVIQVATFAAQEDAQKLAERFKAESFNAFIKPLSRSGGRVYYCVFIGRFATSQEADTILAEFKKKEIAQPFQDAFIRLMQ